MTFAGQEPDNRRVAIEGVAALAITAFEMGHSEDQVLNVVAANLHAHDLLTPADVRAVAAAVSRSPQPVDEAADVRERKRHIERMLGVTSPEDQLSAVLSARDLLERIARSIEEQN